MASNSFIMLDLLLKVNQSEQPVYGGTNSMTLLSFSNGCDLSFFLEDVWGC